MGCGGGAGAPYAGAMVGGGSAVGVGVTGSGVAGAPPLHPSAIPAADTAAPNANRPARSRRGTRRSSAGSLGESAEAQKGHACSSLRTCRWQVGQGINAAMGRAYQSPTWGR